MKLHLWIKTIIISFLQTKSALLVEKVPSVNRPSAMVSVYLHAHAEHSAGGSFSSICFCTSLSKAYTDVDVLSLREW